ncbi:MAG: response regulator, partial [Cyanobacteriota bacterium]|nr:response regulator [Cyanobacteriota bacterium]
MNTPLSSPSKETILIVDSHPEEIQAICNMLIEREYKVKQARTGQLALTEAQIHLPALILLDVEMPNFNG